MQPSMPADSVCCLWAIWCVSLIVVAKDNEDHELPLIVWWYDTIFPHIEDGKQLHDIVCSGASRCQSSHDRAMTKDRRFQSILFYGSDFVPDDVPLPRKDHQMWALLHEESPLNNFILCQEEVLELFNFTSTFKQYSDFPLTTQHVPNASYLFERGPLPIQRKNEHRAAGLAPIVFVQSHCDVPSDRDSYVKELMKYIQVDSYGECLHNKDFPDGSLKGMESMHQQSLLDLLSKYKFQLTFENAVCDDYITEKPYRALHVGSVPVYGGAANIAEWTPANSVIKITDYSSPQALADFLKELDEDDERYVRYLRYKQGYDSLPVKLKSGLEKRKWATDDPLLPHFVQGFECYVCEKMHEILLDGHHIGNRVVANKSHLDCPAPKPSLESVGDFENKFDGISMWIEDYEQTAFQAAALSDLVRSGDADASKVWEIVAGQMMKAKKHEEL